MSRQQLEEQKREHAEHLSNELNKFLNAYNEVSGVQIQYQKDDYPNIIKQLGHYLYGLENDYYLDTVFTIEDDRETITIDMSLFKDTKYEKKSYNFIKSLKEMFNYKNTIDVSTILSTFPDFTDSQREVCFEFYDKLNELSNSMHRSIFSDNKNVNTVTEKDSISKYQNELKHFNEYTMKISSNVEHARAIHLFNDAMQQVLLQKQYTKFFFDA